MKERANYTINTGLLSTSQNKERICDLFMKNGGAKDAMRLTIMSFGFKFGLPPEADLVLDVRCLPNPFYVPELKHKTGLDQEVVDFVMSHPEAQELLRRYENFLQYALPLYVKEGKSQLTIAVGCTGGKHRSITFARKLAEYCTHLWATSPGCSTGMPCAENRGNTDEFCIQCAGGNRAAQPHQGMLCACSRLWYCLLCQIL
ncbi:MAG: hypothetical protein ACLVJH_13910 [Faecalibacterium prausnitzii]